MVPLRAGILLLPLLLAGCQGTPFGDRLSASFPGAPAAGSPQSGSAPAPPNQGAPQAPRPVSPAVPSTAASPAARPAGKAAPTSARPAPPQPARPPTPTGAARASATAPYRITLRLPLADPAAPAEGVTQALRAAGVPFEVETIERMNATPAGDVPATGAPAVRPAPPPR